MKKRCICTIICSNYIAYARTLHESIIREMGEIDFYVLVLDSKSPPISSKEDFEIITPDQLQIPDIKKMAFIYDALELSTNVKPSLLKHLLNLGYQSVVYLDPDIALFNSIDFLFVMLDAYSIVLTPHSLSPYNDDDLRPSDHDLLLNGVFNLGFIGISANDTTNHFLDWWEARCKKLGFREQRTGLMVDQKWINLAPCYFDNVKISKHPGCNVAYWNLHERTIQFRDGRWYVNENQPLVFYHFSGLMFDNGKNISKYQNRYTLDKQSEIKLLFDNYNNSLCRNGVQKTIKGKYKYDFYDNGEPISMLARRMYGHYQENNFDDDPFKSNGEFYKWAKAKHLIAYSKSSDKYTSMNYDIDDIRLRVLHFILRCTHFLLGVDKYTMLLKYLNYISFLRNQYTVFPYNKK